MLLKGLSWECHSWLLALRELAASQATEFSLQDVHRRLNHLQKAKHLLQVGAFSEEGVKALEKVSWFLFPLCIFSTVSKKEWS